MICMGFFGVWGLFVWVVIVADCWLHLEPVLETNGHGARAGRCIGAVTAGCASPKWSCVACIGCGLEAGGWLA